jgi:hypothetical protein
MQTAHAVVRRANARARVGASLVGAAPGRPDAATHPGARVARRVPRALPIALRTLAGECHD